MLQHRNYHTANGCTLYVLLAHTPKHMIIFILYKKTKRDTASWLTAYPTLERQIEPKVANRVRCDGAQHHRPSRQRGAEPFQKRKHDPEQHLKPSAHLVIYLTMTTTTKTGVAAGASTLQPISLLPTSQLFFNRPCHVCCSYVSTINRLC